MESGSIILCFWIFVALVVAFAGAYVLAALALLNPLKTVSIINAIIFIVFVVPLLTVVAIAHIHYFIPATRPAIDKAAHEMSVALDRKLYLMNYDDISANEPMEHWFGQLPHHKENYDLVILDEYCRTRITPGSTYEDEQRWCQFPISEVGRQTYFLTTDYGTYVYNMEEARARYLEKTSSR